MFFVGVVPPAGKSLGRVQRPSKSRDLRPANGSVSCMSGESIDLQCTLQCC